MGEYHDILAKALSYLEKSYACDPSEQELATINRLLGVLGPKAKPGQFEQRIAASFKDCITLLSDDEGTL